MNQRCIVISTYLKQQNGYRENIYNSLLFCYSINEVCKMFKDNLKKYRKEKGFSQNDLAQKLFVSRQCISKWERGITQPDLQALTQLSDLFEVSIDVLIKENKDNINQSIPNNNKGLCITNIFIAFFCFVGFIIAWRFLPITIPAHWTNGVIDRFGNRNEIFINEITVIVFLVLDIFIYLMLRNITDKKTIYISHGSIAIFQIGYFVFIIAVYAKYLNSILSFISCLSIVLILCMSMAIHPKIVKANYLLCVRTKETLKSNDIWKKTNALACYLFSIYSLLLLVINMLWINKFNLLFLLGYLLLTILAVLYSKKICRTLK